MSFCPPLVHLFTLLFPGRTFLDFVGCGRKWQTNNSPTYLLYEFCCEKNGFIVSGGAKQNGFSFLSLLVRFYFLLLPFCFKTPFLVLRLCARNDWIRQQTHLHL
jgi:hypothetical protein